MSTKTLRTLVEEFAYNRIDEMAGLIELYGDDTKFCGYPAFADDTNMVKGATVGCIINLAVYRFKKGDVRYKNDIKRINDFSKLFVGVPTATWGKRLLLAGLVCLYDAGLWGELSKEALEIYTSATDYIDFLDPETLTLKKNLPTNYYHVAMACAAYREKLGMENDDVSDRLLSKLMDIMDSYSTEGWSDEAPGYGRFDSYTVESPGEIIAPLWETGKEIPEKLMGAMKKSVDLCISLANGNGHGFMYGRSLSYHGDATPVSVLSQGLKLGLIPEKDIETVKKYIVNCVKKITEFWYDRELGAINMWLGGRATNGYRNISRIFEVDNGAKSVLMRVLDVAEKFGFANYPVEYTQLGYTDKWDLKEVVFDKAESSMRSLYILRRCGKVFGLPFICGGKSHHMPSYGTFPASVGYLEAPPETELDFLVPRFTLGDGSVIIPKCFWECVEAKTGDDFCVIYAKGKMTDVSSKAHDRPVKSDKSFGVTFEFAKDKIKVTYTAPGADVSQVKMMYSGNAKISGIGFDTADTLDVSDSKYNAWHGAPEKGIQWKGSANTVGYEIDLA